MTIKLKTTEFLNVLNFANGIAPTNPITPILANILISSQDNSLIIRATSGDLAGIIKLDGYNFDWETTVPVGKLLAFFKTIKSEECEIEFNGNKDKPLINIKTGKTKRTMECLDAEDFPRTQDFEETDATVFEIEAGDLSKIIEKTKISISTNDARPQLGGLFMQLREVGEENFVRVVSTDGHRLSLADAKISSKVAHKGVLIPKKSVEEIQKILAKTTGNIRFFIGTNKIKMVTGEFTFISKLLEYEFPQYDRVVPVANDKVLEAETKEFIGAIEEVSSTYFGSKETSLKMLLQANGVSLEAKIGAEVGNSDFDATFKHSEEMEVLYNYQYLLQSLKIIDTQKVQIFYGERNAPCLIKPYESSEYMFVIMPIRT